MRTLGEILEISAGRKGGEAAIFDGFEPSLSAQKVAAIPDDRWLAQMTRSIFQAGFNWKVVDNMWSGFEAAFRGFDPGPCAFMDDEWFDALVTDKSIVRHGPKIRAVQENAAFILDVRKEHGSFGRMIADWPREDYAALLLRLKADGSRLGGTTGQYFLRFMGVDGYILSRDVVGRLIAEGVIDKAPASKKAMMAVQAAVNEWARESGRSLKEISRILATSTG